MGDAYSVVRIRIICSLFDEHIGAGEGSTVSIGFLRVMMNEEG